MQLLSITMSLPKQIFLLSLLWPALGSQGPPPPAASDGLVDLNEQAQSIQLKTNSSVEIAGTGGITVSCTGHSCHKMRIESANSDGWYIETNARAIGDYALLRIEGAGRFRLWGRCAGWDSIIWGGKQYCDRTNDFHTAASFHGVNELEWTCGDGGRWNWWGFSLTSFVTTTRTTTTTWAPPSQQYWDLMQSCTGKEVPDREVCQHAGHYLMAKHGFEHFPTDWVVSDSARPYGCSMSTLTGEFAWNISPLPGNQDGSHMLVCSKDPWVPFCSTDLCQDGYDGSCNGMCGALIQQWRSDGDVDFEDDPHWGFARGFSGYDAGEAALITLQGPGTLVGRVNLGENLGDCQAWPCDDLLTVFSAGGAPDGRPIAGSIVDFKVPAGMHSIRWESLSLQDRFSGAGWELRFYPGVNPRTRPPVDPAVWFRPIVVHLSVICAAIVCCCIWARSPGSSGPQKLAGAALQNQQPFDTELGALPGGPSASGDGRAAGLPNKWSGDDIGLGGPKVWATANPGLFPMPAQHAAIMAPGRQHSPRQPIAHTGRAQHCRMPTAQEQVQAAGQPSAVINVPIACQQLGPGGAAMSMAPALAAPAAFMSQQQAIAGLQQARAPEQIRGCQQCDSI